MTATIWSELGIEPGSDEAAIRRAYARKLKITQPEDNPEGFQKLREAYEQARRIAGRPKVPLGTKPAILVEAVPEEIPPPEVAKPDTEADLLRANLDEQGRALVASLKSKDPLRRSHAVDLQTEILASPLLDDLVTRSSVELWMAHQIAEHIPKSDMLVDRAAAFFGWNRLNYRQPSLAVTTVLRRQGEIALITALTDPQHEGHRGWRALSNGEMSDARRQMEALRPTTRRWVSALLKKMATTHPGLRQDLNPDAILWWQKRLTPSPIIRAMWPIPVTSALSFLAMIDIRERFGLFTLPIGLGVSLAVAVSTALLQVLVVRRHLSHWLRAHPRTADARWWISALVLLPVLGWGLALNPTMLIWPVIAAAAVLSWQDACLENTPSISNDKHAALKIGIGLITPCVIFTWLSSMLGAPAIYYWFAANLPFVILWVRGSPDLLAKLRRFSDTQLRILTTGSLGFALAFCVAAAETGSSTLHIGTIFLVGPLALIPRSAIALQPTNQRRRLSLVSRVTLLAQLVLIVSWS